MIPLPGFGTKLIIVGVAAAGLFLYVRSLQISRDHWRQKHDEVSATLGQERASHKKAMEDADAQRKLDLDAAFALRDATHTHLQARIAHHASTADDLRQRLRNAERSRLRPLAPAASAPADCGNYEADPTRLSEQARDFLVWEAAAAEEHGELLLACRKDYQVVLAACGVKTD